MFLTSAANKGRGDTHVNEHSEALEAPLRHQEGTGGL